MRPSVLRVRLCFQFFEQIEFQCSWLIFTLLLGSTFDYLALGSEGPGFESWLC